MPPVYRIPKVKPCQQCAAAKARCVPEYGSTRCKRCNERNADCMLKAPDNISRGRLKSKTKSTTTTTATQALPSLNRGSTLPAPQEIFPFSGLAAQVFEVQQGIDYYRRSLCQWFPFVLLSDIRQPIADFVREKPFLSLIIAMLGCTKNCSRQRELASLSRCWLATHVMQEGRKSLDILQGLLLATHWYTFQAELSAQRNIFMHLALSLVVDLGLVRSPLARRRMMTREEAAGSAPVDSAPEHTLEEKRALLGCFYLSSAIATTSLSIESPAYFNTYSEQCYLELGNCQLYSDQLISHLCHLQHLLERLFAAKPKVTLYKDSDIHPYSRESFTATTNITGESTDILVDYITQWDAILTSIWASIPNHAKSPSLLLQYTYTRLSLHSSTLSHSHSPSPSPSPISPLTARYTPLITALQSLQNALLPLYEAPHTILDIPLHCFARANHSMAIALRLCGTPGVDAAAVERELRLANMFAHVEERIAELVQGSGEGSLPWYFERLGPMARAIREGVGKRLEASAAAAVDGSSESSGRRGEDSGGDTGKWESRDFEYAFSGEFLDMDGDLWLQRLLGEEESF